MGSQMARYQIGEQLKAGDKRVPWVMDQMRAFAGHPFAAAFYEKYREQFNLPEMEDTRERQKKRKIPTTLRFSVLERDGFACVYCGRSAPGVVLEVDHVNPESSGGKTDSDNLVTACWECNRGKEDKALTKPLRSQEQEHEEHPSDAPGWKLQAFFGRRGCAIRCV